MRPACPAHLRSRTPPDLSLGVASEADVRKIARSLPGTTEKPSYGAPGFRVKDTLFLRVRSEAEGGLVVFVDDKKLVQQFDGEEPRPYSRRA
jgi:hypothetical protein